MSAIFPSLTLASVLALMPSSALCGQSPKADAAGTPQATGKPAAKGSAAGSRKQSAKGKGAEEPDAYPEVPPADPYVATVPLWPVPTVPPEQRVRLAPELLAILNSADYTRRFNESYISETDIEPKLSDAEKPQMSEVFRLIQEDKLAEAGMMIDQNRTVESSAMFDFTMGNIAFQLGNVPRAMEEYERAVQRFPKFRRAWRNLAMLRVRAGELEKAVPALIRVIELGGAEPSIYGVLGYALSNSEKPLAAESAYRMAMLLDPGTRDWKLGLVKSFFKQKRYADVIAMTDELIGETPDAPDLWMLQANAYIGMGKAMMAAQNFEIVDRMGKTSIEALSMLADIYVNEGLYDVAVTYYIRALGMEPRGKAERPIRAAKVLVARGAPTSAETLIGAVERVFEGELADDERKEILKMRARMAVARGAGEEEAEILNEIVSLDPLDGEALILLGQYHARKGEPEQAIFLYERAAKIERFEADAKVRHAQLLVGRGNYAEALPLLRSAQQLKPRENIQAYLEQVERVSRGR
jgi:tetratricopeptide (TPR) repeat protein